MLSSSRLRKRTKLIGKIPLNMYYFILGFALVMFWRGAWRIMDHYFFPGLPLLSHLIPLLFALSFFLWNNGKLDELVGH